MPLKIELKADERVILGDCIVTNQGPRTRLLIEGKAPILREKDILTAERADTPAKRIYLALQLTYTSRDGEEHRATYFKLIREMLENVPGARPLIDSINNRILTGDLYKALKEARKLIAYEKDRSEMQHASKAYAKVATETASPRDLEASLLLKAAARLQTVHDAWDDEKPDNLDDAVLYNRRLWTILMDAVMRDDNKLPKALRDNLTRLGVYIMAESFSLMTKPKPNHLKSIIKVNRSLAAGLRARH
jgi:flagellar biosynthesis repressor protein FlbT